MGIIDKVKRILNKEETAALAEELERDLQQDLDFVAAFYSWIDSPRDDNELDLTGEISEILDDIAQRRQISNYEESYWRCFMIPSTFSPRFGDLADKQMALTNAARAVNLPPFETLLVLDRVESAFPDLSNILMFPQGNC